MIMRAAFAWCAILLIAILNGGFREAFLVPSVGLGPGRAISTVMLSVLILLFGSVLMPWIEPGTLQDAWTIGAFWVALTLAFEFLGGHFVFGKPWQELLADYNLLAGRIGVMVLIITLMTPVVAFTVGGP